MSRDMMPQFELYQPVDIGNALELLARYGAGGWRLAGGQDSYDWFKDRAKRPKAVIDLTGIEELKGIRETPDGLEVGALTTLTELAGDERVQRRYGLLAQAAGQVASPQIRNVGTLGGNLCQDARCWYYRYGLDCYRAGGQICYADTPQGMNREHCLFGADRCVAVSPSDLATASVALEARMVVVNQDGEREVPAEEFFIGPKTDIERMTVLAPDELLQAVRYPKRWSGARYYFEKVADRSAWDFALVSVASVMEVSEGVIQDARVVCGAVECVPRRLKAVEAVIQGSPHNAETAELAGRSATRGATPLNYNHFKIPLMENLVKRAVRDA